MLKPEAAHSGTALGRKLTQKAARRPPRRQTRCTTRHQHFRWAFVPEATSTNRPSWPSLLPCFSTTPISLLRQSSVPSISLLPYSNFLVFFFFFSHPPLLGLFLTRLREYAAILYTLLPRANLLFPPRLTRLVLYSVPPLFRAPLTASPLLHGLAVCLCDCAFCDPTRCLFCCLSVLVVCLAPQPGADQPLRLTLPTLHTHAGLLRVLLLLLLLLPSDARRARLASLVGPVSQ